MTEAAKKVKRGFVRRGKKKSTISKIPYTSYY